MTIENNFLAINTDNKFLGMSREELAILREKRSFEDKLIYAAEMKYLATNFENFKTSVETEQKKLDIKLDNLEIELKQGLEESRTNKKVAINCLAIKERPTEDPWKTLTKLGNELYQVKISNRQMGDLLRVVGLAKKYSLTEPFDVNVPKYAITVKKEDRQGFMRTEFEWHLQNCRNKILKWFEKNGLTDEFYSKKDEDAMEVFIKELVKNWRSQNG